MAKPQKPDGQTLFNGYLSSKDAVFRPCLIAMREIILAAVPYAEESFSYQAHCFKYVYMLVGIGINKDSCSLYTMSPPLVKAMKTELKDYEISGATIHFKTGKQLPAELITRIVMERVKQNETLSLARKKQ